MLQITRHCAERAAERYISDREIIAALKCGVKQRSKNQCNTITAVHNDIAVVYEIIERTSVRLITCWRRS